MRDGRYKVSRKDKESHHKRREDKNPVPETHNYKSVVKERNRKEDPDEHNYKSVVKERNRKEDPIEHNYKSVVKERNRKEDPDEHSNRRKAKDNSSRSHSDQRKPSEVVHVEPFRRTHHQDFRAERTSDRYQEKENSSSESESENPRRRRKRESPKQESYEELAKKKKKIELELRALDMEEAAEREAENKKSRRSENNDHKSRVRTVRIKKEPVDSRNSPETRRRNTSQDNHKQKHRREPSRSPKDWGRSADESKKPVDKPVEKPNFAVSGKLAEDTNTYNGVVIKYNEPQEARKPRRKWRLYPFKGDTSLPFIPVHRQSAYLFGRTRLIADIPIDHPSCSKQHAVLQFRLVTYKRDDGTQGKRVRPYIIDLESSNGTFVNNKRIDPRRYMELMEKDVVKFGFSSREYVVLHEESKKDFEDDDVLEDKSE